MQKKLTSLLLAHLVAAGCSKLPETVNPQPGPVPVDPPVQEDPLWPEGSTVVGTVTAMGKGLEGVVVSDGCLTTRTDADGRWSLTVLPGFHYIVISSYLC